MDPSIVHHLGQHLEEFDREVMEIAVDCTSKKGDCLDSPLSSLKSELEKCLSEEEKQIAVVEVFLRLTPLGNRIQIGMKDSQIVEDRGDLVSAPVNEVIVGRFL